MVTTTSVAVSDALAGDQRPSVAAHAPGPWTWRDVSGAGLQISATLPAGFQFSGTARGCADGETSFMIWTVRDSHQVQISDERWVQFSTGSWEAMQEANARLIAAAPDMLALLKEVANDALCQDGAPPGVGTLERINEVIAKAEDR